jgi:hypothetical protein
VRAWTGQTNRGTAVTAFIAALSGLDGQGAELVEQLREIPGPQIGQVKIDTDDQTKGSQ